MDAYALDGSAAADKMTDSEYSPLIRYAAYFAFR
jgi:hypothetical protein